MIKRKLLLAAMMAGLSSVAMVGCSNLGDFVQGTMIAGEVIGKKMSAEDLVQAQKTLQADSKVVSTKILGAQQNLASALDLKKMVAEIQAQLQTIKTGNITADQLEKVTTISQDADEAINARLEDTKQLTEEQKQKVQKSLGEYAGAALFTAKIAANAAQTGLGLTQYLRDIAVSNPTKVAEMKGQFGFLADASATLPGFTADLIETGWSYTNLLKSYGVDVSGAEKMLTEAGSFMK